MSNEIKKELCQKQLIADGRALLNKEQFFYKYSITENYKCQTKSKMKYTIKIVYASKTNR